MIRFLFSSIIVCFINKFLLGNSPINDKWLNCLPIIKSSNIFLFVQPVNRTGKVTDCEFPE